MAAVTPDPADLLTQLFTQKPPETAEQMRALLDGFAGLLNADLPEVGELHAAVPVAPGVHADVVVPRGRGPHPVLVYLHGGGWICGSPTTHRKLGYRFAEAGYLVFNVDYRLAPEHPFPTPLEDCLAAIRFAAREAGRFGGDPQRLAVGGDSAGGNLSAAAAIELFGSPEAPKAALLIYGVFDFAALRQAHEAAAPGPLADAGRQLVDLMVGDYLGTEPDPARLADPRVSPLHGADRLPPCHVVVGGADPLVTQAEQLAKALADAGVDFEHYVDEGMPHGYVQLEFLTAARPAIDRMIAFLRARV
jgi:acetyl esterase